MKNNKKANIKRRYRKNSSIYLDPDLPTAPRLQIYKETFGGLENITEQWYKENRA